MARHWNLPDELAQAIEAQARTADDPPERTSVPGMVMRARIFARAAGVSDGLDLAPRPAAPREWLIPPLSLCLDEFGGVPDLLSRVDAFLATALA